MRKSWKGKFAGQTYTLYVDEQALNRWLFEVWLRNVPAIDGPFRVRFTSRAARAGRKERRSSGS
jgi:hypothetical protein